MDDLVQRVTTAQHVLGQLLAAARLDPARPQEVARRLGIDKSLAWKLCRMVQVRGTADIVRLIPGTDGWEIALNALGAAGADGEMLTQARTARLALAATVEEHCSDREEFEIILDGLDSSGQLMAARKLAYRGASGLLGQRARCAVGIAIAWRSAADPTTLDIVSVLGLVGLRRLRTGPLKPAFGTTSGHGGPEPLQKPPAGTAPDYVLREFSCKADPGSVHAVPLGDLVEVGQLPVGRHGECTLFLGMISRNAEPIAVTPQHPTIDIGFASSVPVLQLSRVVCMERTILSDQPLRARLLNSTRLERPRDPVRAAALEHKIPLRLEVSPDASGPVFLAAYPEFERLMARSFELAGLDRRNFVMARVDMDYPPLHSILEINATPRE